MDVGPLIDAPVETVELLKDAPDESIATTIFCPDVFVNRAKPWAFSQPMPSFPKGGTLMTVFGLALVTEYTPAAPEPRT